MTYWQRIPGIVGPARAEDFHRIGQQETRLAAEGFILKHSDAQTKVLDAGCNTGITGWRLFQKGFLGRYYGVDSNWKALLFAEGNTAGHNAVYKQDDLAKLSFPDQYADIVFSKDVIEHCLGYDDILKELCRVTRKFFILSMFIHMTPGPDQIRPTPEGFYMNRYNQDRLIGLVTSLGFRYQLLFEKGEDEVLLFERQV